MKISEKGLDLVRHFEGLYLEAYKDVVGVPTIGYGHTDGVKMGTKITVLEAIKLLQEDMKEFENEVNSLELDLEQHQFDALVSFAFNVGGRNLRAMVSGAMSRDGLTSVPSRILLYRNAGGKPYAGLIRRRLSEATLFSDGKLVLFSEAGDEIKKLAKMAVPEYVTAAMELIK